jgi:hypothetical protein
MAAAQHRVKVGAAPDHACMDITAATAAAASPSDGRASAINCVHASLASPNGATARRPPPNAAIRRSIHPSGGPARLSVPHPATTRRRVSHGTAWPLRAWSGDTIMLVLPTRRQHHQSRGPNLHILDVNVAHAHTTADNFLHLPGK